ncbi:MAG: hypothetical protein ABI230_08360 [Aestuariivirga sp.]
MKEVIYSVMCLSFFCGTTFAAKTVRHYNFDCGTHITHESLHKFWSTKPSEAQRFAWYKKQGCTMQR